MSKKIVLIVMGLNIENFWGFVKLFLVLLTFFWILQAIWQKKA